MSVVNIAGQASRASTDSSWIQTYTGRAVFPLELVPSDVCIEDIAHHLARVGRFTGATRGENAYSVAQHCVLVSLYCDHEDALWGLLHDASEAYLLDLPRPLKRHPEFAFYRRAEARAMLAICSAFDLPIDMPESVRKADERMLATEARDLMSPLHPDWRVMEQPYRRTVVPWPAKEAERAFLSRFHKITTSPEIAAADAEGYR